MLDDIISQKFPGGKGPAAQYVRAICKFAGLIAEQEVLLVLAPGYGDQQISVAAWIMRYRAAIAEWQSQYKAARGDYQKVSKLAEELEKRTNIATEMLSYAQYLDHYNEPEPFARLRNTLGATEAALDEDVEDEAPLDEVVEEESPF